MLPCVRQRFLRLRGRDRGGAHSMLEDEKTRFPRMNRKYCRIRSYVPIPLRFSQVSVARTSDWQGENRDVLRAFSRDAKCVSLGKFLE